MKTTMLILFAGIALSGCSQKHESAATAAAKPQPRIPAAVTAATAVPASAPVAAPLPAPATAAGAVTGKVVETMNAGGYTYLKIATSAGNVWAAVRETTVAKGATVTVMPQMVAENFESNTLHRKFDRLVMGALVSSSAHASVPAQPPAPNPMAAAASAMGTPAQHMSSSMIDIGDGKVAKADGGITIAEAWSKKDSLKDQPVVIRGKVVKFLADIMGKNWLHLRDGSSSHADGTDDVTVTTNDVVKVGDVVTVRGTLRVDKDFGAGYLYPIIVEDAKLEK